MVVTILLFLRLKCVMDYLFIQYISLAFMIIGLIIGILIILLLVKRLLR